MHRITFTELLLLLDGVTRYGYDDVSRNVLDHLPESHVSKHVVSRAYAKTLINRYVHKEHVRRHGKPPETKDERDSIIEITGNRTATRYKHDDILTMLQDPDVKRLLHARYLDRMVEHDGKLVPRIAVDAHEAERLRPALDNRRLTTKHKEAVFRKDIRFVPTSELHMQLRVIESELMMRDAIERGTPS